MQWDMAEKNNSLHGEMSITKLDYQGIGRQVGSFLYYNDSLFFLLEEHGRCK